MIEMGRKRSWEIFPIIIAQRHSGRHICSPFGFACATAVSRHHSFVRVSLSVYLFSINRMLKVVNNHLHLTVNTRLWMKDELGRKGKERRWFSSSPLYPRQGSIQSTYVAGWNLSIRKGGKKREKDSKERERWEKKRRGITRSSRRTKGRIESKMRRNRGGKENVFSRHWGLVGDQSDLFPTPPNEKKKKSPILCVYFLFFSLSLSISLGAFLSRTFPAERNQQQQQQQEDKTGNPLALYSFYLPL